MQYMLLCCIDEALWAALPDQKRQGIMNDYDKLIQEMVTAGHYRGGGKLMPTHTATTLRKEQGELITMDGPFAETKEQLGGFHVIECEHLDQALAFARRIPPLSVGGVVEVRPLDPAYQL
ncbi:MAG: YciI family protein [Halopseudomonas sp.]|uniref:YciI family protein n=1 Tax=Halopseudomonas sp. TaxID=2901191 RepID=UPI003002662E